MAHSVHGRGEFNYRNGELSLHPEDEAFLMQQLRTATINHNWDEVRAFGSLITEPISTVANYEEWSDKLFKPMTVQPGEDWAIPLEEYNLTAYFSSPDGRTRRSRPGLYNTRPSFISIDSGFELGWNDMENATWNIVGNKVMRTGQEIARKRDQAAFSVINTAVDNVGHVVNTTGGLMTRTSVEAILKQSAAIGFPIKRVIVSPATALDMRSSSFFTWDNASHFPLGLLPDAQTQELFQTGYLANYGGAQWYTSIGLSSGTTLTSGTSSPSGVASGAAVVIYAGDPPDNGFNVQRGSIRQMTDIDIDLKINKWNFDETRFFYVANAYRFWMQVITS